MQGKISNTINSDCKDAALPLENKMFGEKNIVASYLGNTAYFK
jgi:hypothetical protein